MTQFTAHQIGADPMTAVALTLAQINTAKRNPSPVLGFASSRPSQLQPSVERKLTYFDELAESLGLVLDEPTEEDLMTGHVR